MDEAGRGCGGLPHLESGLDVGFLLEDNWMEASVDDDWLDFEKPYERPKWTLSYGGSPFAPVGGIHVLTGKPGNGKTMTFTQMMVAVLCGRCGGLRYEYADVVPEPTVLYIDTEMEEDNTIAVKNRVCRMAGHDERERWSRLKILRLRNTVNAVDRWRKVLKAIYEVRPTVCFIDGIIDLVDDFNSVDSCQPLIYKCMQVATHYNVSLWCIIHENPFTVKMVGHLGSIIERKTTDVFATVKEKDTATGEVKFKVEQRKARGKDVDSWVFQVVSGAEGYGIPEEINASVAGITPDRVKLMIEQHLNDLEWPATATQISEVLLKNAGLKLREDRRKAYEIAVNRRFLVPQDKGEMGPGQRCPKMYVNPEEFEFI